MNVLEKSTENVTVSARVNKYIFEQYKDAEIPISPVIEASLVSFLKMSLEKRISFLAQNAPANVDESELVATEEKWPAALDRFGKPSGLMLGVTTSAVPNKVLFATLSMALRAIAKVATEVIVKEMTKENKDKSEDKNGGKRNEEL